MCIEKRFYPIIILVALYLLYMLNRPKEHMENQAIPTNQAIQVTQAIPTNQVTHTDPNQPINMLQQQQVCPRQNLESNLAQLKQTDKQTIMGMTKDLGCVRDEVDRLIPINATDYVKHDYSEVTPENCVKYAIHHRYDIMGLQNGNECWVGDRNYMEDKLKKNNKRPEGVNSCGPMGDAWVNRAYAVMLN